MTTQDAFAKVCKNQTDQEIINKYKLKANSQAQITSILRGMKKSLVSIKSLAPQEYKHMSEWAKNFENAWTATKVLNGDNVTPLSYLINYSIETNTEGFQLMSQVAFLSYEFQNIFSKYLVKKK